MKYILMMNAPRAGWEGLLKWPKEDLRAHMDFMKTFTKGLADAGKLAGAEGLDVPAQAKMVRSGKNGRPVTDGVFAETKEFLAGYWIVDCRDAGAGL